MKGLAIATLNTAGSSSRRSGGWKVGCGAAGGAMRAGAACLGCGGAGGVGVGAGCARGRTVVGGCFIGSASGGAGEGACGSAETVGCGGCGGFSFCCLFAIRIGGGRPLPPPNPVDDGARSDFVGGASILIVVVSSRADVPPRDEPCESEETSEAFESELSLPLFAAAEEVASLIMLRLAASAASAACSMAA